MLFLPSSYNHQVLVSTIKFDYLSLWYLIPVFQYPLFLGSCFIIIIQQFFKSLIFIHPSISACLHILSSLFGVIFWDYRFLQLHVSSLLLPTINITEVNSQWSTSVVASNPTEVSLFWSHSHAFVHLLVFDQYQFLVIISTILDSGYLVLVTDP